MTKRKSEKWTVFSFEYSIKPFAALESCGKMLEDEKVKWQLEEWSESYLGELISSDIASEKIEDLSTKYKGTISIELAELSASGVVVGKDLKIKMQPHNEGVHGSLPQAKLKVIVRLKGLDGKTIRGLKAILKETKKTDWKRIVSEESRRIKQWKATKGNGKTGDAESKRFEEINQDIETLLQEIPKGFEEIEPILSRDTFWDIMARMAPAYSKISEKRDEKGNRYRSKVSSFLSLFKDEAKSEKPRAIHFDVDSVESFGGDLFKIFRYYVNLIIRYLKYDQQQYWLQEVDSTEQGYFYIRNEVLMNGEGPLIPDAKHHLEFDRLDIEYLLSEANWRYLRPILADMEELKTKAGGFSLGGIFSQAIISLQEKHLETAVVLGMVGLEAAMAHLIEYFKGQEVGVIRYETRVGFVQRVLERARIPATVGKEYPFLWRLVEGEPIAGKRRARKYFEYGDGLIPLRNKVIHEAHQINHLEQRRIVEFISASRSLSFIIENWLASKPVKGLANGIRFSSPRRRKGRRK